MSRTKKGNKGSGYDYWGKRALSGDCGYGPDVKRLTHGIERARAKQALLKEPREPEYDEREYVPNDEANTNSTVDDRERRYDLSCSFSRPNRGENAGRRPKHGKTKPRHKDHRR